MPGGWPLRVYDANPQSLGGDLAASNGVAVTCSASTNTYGAWTEIIASMPADMVCMMLQISNMKNQPFQGVVDIAVAPAGSEATGMVIAGVMLGMPQPMQTSVRLPVGPIPAGSRIAARAASVPASAVFNVQITGMDGDYIGAFSPGVYDTYGWSGAGTVTGFSIDPGTTANTKGAWTEITAGLTNDIQGFFLGFDCQSHIGNSSSVGAPNLLDIGAGAAGSEVVLVPDILVSKAPENYTAAIAPTHTGLLHIPIAAGTRIAARSQSSNATASDRAFGLSFYGLRA